MGEGGPGSKTFEEMSVAKAQGWPNKNGSMPVEKEPMATLEEARMAAENGWVSDNYSGYYEERKVDIKHREPPREGRLLLI